MPSLMDLPLEIRLMIFKETINGRRTPPMPPSKSHRGEITYWQDRDSCHRHKLCHEVSDSSNSLPLLLISRQASVETQSILNRMKKTTYVLDLSILNEEKMFTTWILVPRLTTRLSALHIDVRLFGHMFTSNDVQERRARRYRGNNGLSRFFYEFLERSLLYGTLDKKGSSGISLEDRVITVENLVLDFRSAETKLPFPPSDMDYSDWMKKDFGNSRFSNEQVDEDEALKYTTRPEWPLCTWSTWLRGMTIMRNINEMYGGLIYERIGTISMLVNGGLETTVDLTGELAKVHVYSPLDTWVETTLVGREAHGFPFVQPQDLDRG
ncbi:hypothetical protein E8E15_006204 [Penicillium rubens]|uniref:Uncharacterized protein n=2 Tax=Penicillium chrysogenum species complex TaxID=254878 RepID=B6HJX8_PENRW|nr:uncharacterized protein N7525_006562 [Penicillium rubens]KZN89525.1 hypothetical protein EN45_081360 [Penicillium chrysogenum]CAP96877.1 hypothetical protein PCH_Pc21g19800 [Penicillium rubens Wisconsin 54-1255]KAF3019138.1 hypothetical protein E8E15_006204 [Penicillium rubens]KAJ5049989.1 hypothetical protein NUH16_008516 [Penicillium rubens]KAJ5828309.1 hypothetical protein N7525_006562 [Penicillium rubens]